MAKVIKFKPLDNITEWDAYLAYHDSKDYDGDASGEYVTLTDHQHELTSAHEMALARIGELESQVQRQLVAAQNLYRNSGVVKTAELLARIEVLEAENAKLKDVLMAVIAYRHAKATVPENKSNIFYAYKDLIEALDNANP